MRCLILWKPADRAVGDTDAPGREQLEEVGRLVDELVRGGVLLAAEGLQPRSMGARVMMDRGRLSVTAGVQAAPEDLFAGYAIVNVESREAAIELASRFLKVVGDGVSEIRPLQETSALSRGWLTPR